MLKLTQNKVAVIPVFDSKETKGGIIKGQVAVPKRRVQYYKIMEFIDSFGHKQIDEAEDMERAIELVSRYEYKGRTTYYEKAYKDVETQPFDTGERCDQGVVKYIGSEVKDIKIGDYVFFSGYTGTLASIDGEGTFIIMPENFIECVFDIEQFHKVPGLYFKDRDGNYFQATYEEAMNIMSRSFTDLGLVIDVKPENPKLEDYDAR